MQYKVPQNVDIEDKVIAGLTLRQFTFLMIAGGFVLILKYMLPKMAQPLFVPLSVFVGGVGIALAFLKINDRPLEIFITSAVKGFLRPNRRVWLKEDEIEIERIEKKANEKPVQKKENISEARSKLQSLATLVDSGAQTNIDLPVKDILEKTETPSVSLNLKIKEAKEKTKPTEAPVSSLSTNTPTKDQYKYENIKLAPESELEDLIKKTKEKQIEKENILKNHEINKF